MWLYRLFKGEEGMNHVSVICKRGNKIYELEGTPEFINYALAIKVCPECRRKNESKIL
jgi:hypothetical protein